MRRAVCQSHPVRKIPGLHPETSLRNPNLLKLALASAVSLSGGLKNVEPGPASDFDLIGLSWVAQALRFLKAPQEIMMCTKDQELLLKRASLQPSLVLAPRFPGAHPPPDSGYAHTHGALGHTHRHSHTPLTVTFLGLGPASERINRSVIGKMSLGRNIMTSL